MSKPHTSSSEQRDSRRPKVGALGIFQLLGLGLLLLIVVFVLIVAVRAFFT